MKDKPWLNLASVGVVCFALGLLLMHLAGTLRPPSC